MRFTFEVEGVKQFDRAFDRLGFHCSDLRPVWPHVEREMENIMSEQFKSEGAKGRSGKWKELSPAYAKAKLKRYGQQPILRATGALEQSLTGKSGDSVRLATKEEFGFGTSLFYAAYHQRGGTNLPQREIFSFSDAQRTRLMKEMQKGLVEIIRRDRAITQSVKVED